MNSRVNSRAAVMDLAKAIYHRLGQIEIDHQRDSIIPDESNGAWVTARVYVSFEGTSLDKRRALLAQKQYLAAEGSYCPMCGSADLFYPGIPEVIGNTVDQRAECGECGATWSDMYQLSGYVGLKLSDGTEATIPEEAAE